MDWVGTGLFIAVSTVFFVRVVGLSTVEVGSGLTVGEVIQVGSAWTLSFAIAPAGDRNAYLAAFSLGRAFSRACGPLLMTGVVLALGRAGWIALAALFAAASLAPRRWRSTRPRPETC